MTSRTQYEHNLAARPLFVSVSVAVAVSDSVPVSYPHSDSLLVSLSLSLSATPHFIFGMQSHTPRAGVDSPSQSGALLAGPLLDLVLFIGFRV